MRPVVALSQLAFPFRPGTATRGEMRDVPVNQIDAPPTAREQRALSSPPLWLSASAPPLFWPRASSAVPEMRQSLRVALVASMHQLQPRPIDAAPCAPPSRDSISTRGRRAHG
jgi:hypothetical protein